MINKTRKRIWPVSLMAIALVGVLAVFAAMAVAPNGASAHEGATGSTHCAELNDLQQLGHDEDPLVDHDCATGPSDGTDPGTGNGDGNGDGNGNGMGDGSMHATMPTYFWLEGLDNGARLNWEAPGMVAEHAMVVGYQIDRDAWNQLATHPINMYGGATIMVYAHETSHSDLGLAYETVYTYMVRAKVHYNVEGWWNMLDCVEMNDAVSPTGDEPAVGANTDGTTYCKMYDDLSAEAMVVVQRAYAALDPMAYTYYGEWSMKRTTETADSGGRLAALLDPPTMVQDIDAIAACANMVTVSWQGPSYLGTVPAMNQRGVYVGPDYIGADDAGREEVGTDATSVTYQVQRMVNNGPWATVAHTDMMYIDGDVEYAEAGMPHNVYKYRVRAMNGMRGAGLYGPWSMVTEELKQPPKPLQPTGLVVQATGPNTVELEWQAPEDSVTDPLWKIMADFDRAGDASNRLKYVIERQVNDGRWVEVWEQAHLYADEFEDNRTQAWADEDAPAGLVNYRVSAEVDECNRSPAHQKNAVEVLDPAAEFVGSVAAASAAGSATITWSPADNASSQVVIAVNANDDTDFCLAVKDSIADNHTCSGLTAGADYVILVIALDGRGGYTLDFVLHMVN